jgi:type IV pilus assembly protein PilB
MPQFDDSRINAKLALLKHGAEERAVAEEARATGLPYANLHGITIDTDALKLIPERNAREAGVAAFLEQGNVVSLATSGQNSEATSHIVEELKEKGYSVTLYAASIESLQHAWERYKDIEEAAPAKRGILDIHPDEIAKNAKEIRTYLDVAEKINAVGETPGSQKTSRVIETIFAGALALFASDVHIEPERTGIRLRYRIDGVLFDVAHLNRDLYTSMISRLKLLSGLILNIHNEAQDGRFTLNIGSRELEVRSSVIPGSAGESLVMRILDPDTSSFKFEKLGLNEKLKAVMEEELKRPQGAIITTGPTGSGKTTALYAFMQKVHTPEVKIITIEDPVEYKLPGIVQTQVDDEYTFDTGLKAILRQDPDVIMVGEIRDRDVAETAVQAALTGHLVFSTLHTNSAAGAFPRLMDLGVDYRTIGSAFNVVLGQRLVRILCDECKVKRDATIEEQKLVARIMDEPVSQHTLYDKKGCDACNGSGFRGRIWIFEAILLDKAVEEAVIRDPREANILAAAKPQGIPTMQQDGVLKVLQGVTSLDELARVVDLHGKGLPEESEKADPIAAHTI